MIIHYSERAAQLGIKPKLAILIANGAVLWVFLRFSFSPNFRSAWESETTQSESFPTSGEAHYEFRAIVFLRNCLSSIYTLKCAEKSKRRWELAWDEISRDVRNKIIYEHKPMLWVVSIFSQGFYKSERKKILALARLFPSLYNP